MPPTYYVIELSARWLTALLAALALALVMAFAFGYGAAWSVLSGGPAGAGTETAVAATATEIPEAEVVEGAPQVTPSLATPVPAPTEEPTSAPATATPVPRPTVQPAPAATATPRTQAVRRVEQVFWVQVLAASNRDAMAEAGARLAELGFSRDNQRMVSSPVAGGGTLYKMRIGPFPDRGSADRVVRRMQDSGFPDAWVVAP